MGKEGVPRGPYAKKDEKTRSLVEFLRNNNIMKYKDDNIEISFYPPEKMMQNQGMGDLPKQKEDLPSEIYENELNSINLDSLKRF